MSTLEAVEVYCGAPNAVRGEASHVFADPTGETDSICFASGRSAVLMSVSNPRDVKVFVEHTVPVTSCKFAPKGLMVSGDEGGTVRVWNPATMKQREELPVLADAVRDIAFSADMKFMIMATDQRNVFAKIVKYPGGGSAGAIPSHTKRVTSVDVRNSPKPAIVTGGDDMIVGFIPGPPVPPGATGTTKRHHTNFVLDARFSPDGTKYATTSTDRTVYVIDAETHEDLQVIKEHTGGVSGVAWNKDGTKIVTSSSDKTLRVWDVATGECLQTVQLGDKDFLDMQVGCAWIHKTNELVSVSLRGDISVIDEGATEPKKVMRGHAKPIAGLANVGSTIYTIDGAGLVVSTEIGKAETAKQFTGKGHTTPGKSIAANAKVVVSVENSGNVFLTPVETLAYEAKPVAVKGGCTDMACPADTATYAALIINDSTLYMLGYDGSVTELLKFERGETGISVAVTNDGATVAVCQEVRSGAGTITLYTYEENKLTKMGNAIQSTSSANRMRFTSDGQTLVVGEKGRQVKMYGVADQVKVAGGGACHTARVDGVAFSPDDQKVATVGMDGLLAVWNVRKRDEPVSVKAHRNGCSGVCWLDEETIATAGGDNTIRTWKLA